MDFLRHQLHPPSVRRHGEIGYFGIENRPPLHRLLKLLLRIGVIQQGPVRAWRVRSLLIDRVAR
jgi:hypothetical protein